MSAPDPAPYFGERYTILDLIGSGGMGQVYLAHDRKHDRRVALKVMDPDYARTVGPQRFVREIRIAATLSHPRIVPLYDSGETEGRLFYVMPYVEGESLRQRLKRETMLPLPQALAWAVEICEALAFAHEHGIVHRDIKPENLLIQGDHILLADFGIARAIDMAAGEGLTSAQLVLGTPVYMSPEQAGGGPLDGRADLYSLACVVYEMLAGEPPFAGRSPQALTAKKLSGHYPPVRVVRPTVPKRVDDVLARALAVLPADRFASAEEFANNLRTAAQRRPFPRLAVLGGLALAGLGLWAGMSQVRRTTEGARPRVVVEMFDNRTGDPVHDPLSFMASDWITEGLHRTGAVDVVPTPTVLAARRSLRASRDTLDPALALVRLTGATLLLTGSVYRDQDSLVFHAQLSDPAAGRLVGAVEPLRVSQADPVRGIHQLRERLMGLLALRADDRVLQAELPPTYDAYLAFSEGLDAYVRGAYEPALTSLLQAHAADTTFVLPLLYAAFCYVNRGERARADSVLRIVAGHRQRLNEHDRSWLDYQRAELAGNDSEALAAIRRAAELAPLSKATYNFAATALESRLPFAAESALRRLPPDSGPMKGWAPYWEILTSAQHAQAKHEAELAVAREARRRYPERIESYIAEARALVARDKRNELDRLWLNAASAPATSVSELSRLAYEIGCEVWAHADSSRARVWFERVLSPAAARGPPPNTIESRWMTAQAAARLRRFREAIASGEALLKEDPAGSDDYLGFLGVLAARSGDRRRAGALLDRLAQDHRPYSLGWPQFEAGRIAAVLGDHQRAEQLFVLALDRGYPYRLELHRDEALVSLRGSPIYRQLDAREQ